MNAPASNASTSTAIWEKFMSVSLSKLLIGEPCGHNDDADDQDAFDVHQISSIMNRVTCRHMTMTTRTNTVAPPSCVHVMLLDGEPSFAIKPLNISWPSGACGAGCSGCSGRARGACRPGRAGRSRGAGRAAETPRRRAYHGYVTEDRHVAKHRVRRVDRRFNIGHSPLPLRRRERLRPEDGVDLGETFPLHEQLRTRGGG